MSFAAIFALFLTILSAQSCAAWSPPLHSTTLSIQNHGCYSARSHSTRLAAWPTSKKAPSAPEVEDVTTKPSVSFPWASSTSGASKHSIPDPTDLLEKEDDDGMFSKELLGFGVIAGVLAIAASYSTATSFDVSLADAAHVIEGVIQSPSAALDQVVQTVESMGPLGVAYFGVAYTIAEVLVIPAIPLTASAGYLFGPVEGTTVVLFSASIAATISFVIGRTFLREYVESVLEGYPKFAKLDRAIGKEGFKLMLLLRLSPIFPFALSNYLYGASSITFPNFFWGTLFGFAPGTIAYVCTGAFGKALSVGDDANYPWFVYAGGLTLLGGLIKILADTATRVVEEMEEEDAAESSGR